MKRNIILFIIITLLLSSCTSNQKTEVSDNNTLSETSLDDIRKYEVDSNNTNALMNMIIEYIDTSFEVPIYYFPTDENGLFVLESSDGVFDFFDYFVYGDMNNDGEVDEEDVHIMDEAIIESDKGCDINGDGKTNGNDMVIIVERLLVEAKSFSFYDENKKLIDAEPVLFGDEKTVSINGANKIYVAVNDCNGNNQLNIDNADNVKLALFNPLDLFITNACAVDYSKDIKEVLGKFFEHMDITPDEYLLGWVCGVKAVVNTNSDKTNTNIGQLTPYNSMLTSAFVEKVDNVHFAVYCMLEDTKIAEAERQWSAQAGLVSSSLIGDDNNITTQAGGYQFTNRDFSIHMGEENGVTQKFIIHYYYNIITLPTLETASGKITIEGWDTVNGEITLHRAGPGKDQNEIEITGEINNGEFHTSDKIPSGDIVMDFHCDSCGFDLRLSDDRAYCAPNGSLDVWLEDTFRVYGSVVEDVSNEAVDNVEVTIESICPEMGNNFSATAVTDSDGNYEFLDVPYGIYEVCYKEFKRNVTVNDSEKKEIEVEKIETSGTFDIEIVYKEYITDTVCTASWSDVTIDLETSRTFSGLFLYADGTRMMFDSFDVNSNGKIEAAEAKDMPFAMIDSNSDNLITYEEFTVYLDDQSGFGILLDIDADDSNVECTSGEYAVSNVVESATLTILGIKTSDLEGNSEILYAPDTVCVNWDIKYEITERGYGFIENPIGTFLPASSESIPAAYKSSIPISAFEALIENGKEIVVHDEVENTVAGGLLSEYSLTIKPHE